MKEEDVEIAIKVVVVGNGAVGKSSMIQRYCKGIFTNDYKKTIGVDFLERQIEVDCEDVRLMLWDTAGQEEFDAITKAYYRGAQACVLVFSTVDRDSFKAVESWKSKVENECGTIHMALVQNKIDLVDEALVTREEADDLAKRLRLRFYRTSVKEDCNVSDVFQYLARKYIDQLNEPEVTVNKVEPAASCQKNSETPTKLTHLNKTSQPTNNGNISLHQPKQSKRGKKSLVKGCMLL
ncbi:ras-related protein Rab-23-like [Limulus polyphemus]|uniref:Ras-related protein Rab-23-like n=1 Tax=Limulus polyphemus TaxID=6850 RepID=A0ABM1BVS1_LIMPO|nr:ras-related protein Rab-23-like [Limulus polyphemus]XP_022257616.1 ras-related protein Rab-23-like [Limulus polyphemus]